MRTFYNEWDKPTAEWLRDLCRADHLPAGDIDTRSIRDVQPGDLREYDQCHFFGGIGGWPLALRLAGCERLRSVWTGSPPCQPFSVAGRGLAQADERHLAPHWLALIEAQRPVWVFGEQVDAAIRAGDDQRLLGLSPATVVAACLYACDTGRIVPTAFLRRFGVVGGDVIAGCADDFRQFAVACAVYAPEQSLADLACRAIEGVRKSGWLDDLFDALEGCGYACGAAVLPACSVGAPHIRKRLFFGAVRLADANRGQRHGITDGEGCERDGETVRRLQGDGIITACCEHDGMADAERWSAERHRHPLGGTPEGVQGAARQQRVRHDARDGLTTVGMADALPAGRPERRPWAGDRQVAGSGGDRWPDQDHGGWSRVDWLGCRDGKFRPVKPEIQPLADGLPGRVGLLRGAGNAIVPQAAAVFIQEFIAAVAWGL